MWPFCWIGALLRSGGKLRLNVTLCWIKKPGKSNTSNFWRDKCDDIWTRFCCKKGDKILTSLQEAVHLIMVQYKMVNRRQLLQKSGRSDERWEFWVVTGWHIASHHHIIIIIITTTTGWHIASGSFPDLSPILLLIATNLHRSHASQAFLTVCHQESVKRVERGKRDLPGRVTFRQKLAFRVKEEKRWP